MNTKKRIIESSIRLFNEQGLVNVRLQHIADETKISVGNLAYHFYDKEQIIEYIVSELTNLFNPITDKKEFAILTDFDTQLAKYYHLLIKYSFFFVDILEIERNYPRQYQKRTVISRKIVHQIHYWLIQNAERGILTDEPRPNHYKIIAQSIWILITFYSTRPLHHDPGRSERVFKETIWTQIVPHLTEMGKIQFDLLIEPLLDVFIPTTKQE